MIKELNDDVILQLPLVRWHCVSYFLTQFRTFEDEFCYNAMLQKYPITTAIILADPDIINIISTVFIPTSFWIL